MEYPTLEWVTLENANILPGLRLAVVRAGVPSPWSEFARAVFDSRRIPYIQVDARDPAGGYSRLKHLSSQESLPVAFWNDERPRTTWHDIVALGERLARNEQGRPGAPVAVSLLPAGVENRVRAFGVCDELLGEGGFCWNRRLMFCAKLVRDDAPEQERRVGKYLSRKYASVDVSAEEAQARAEQTLAYLAKLLRVQQERGSPFCVGDSLSIADFAWAACAALIQPLPENLCPMVSFFRDAFTWTPAETPGEDVAQLLAHRDRMYAQYLRLPVITT
jgi:glutathione S-transferase